MLRKALMLMAVMGSTVGGWVLHSWFVGISDDRESAGNKREWAILQTLESNHGNSAISGVQFTNLGDYRITCLPSLSGERLWIMLNPEHPPYYKQIPLADYVLSQQQFEQIVRQQTPTWTVEECLSTHVRRTP